MSRITFTYLIKDGLAPDSRALLNPEIDDKTFNHRFNNMNLPITMNPHEYGEVIVENFVQVSNKAGEKIPVHRFRVRNENKRIFTIDVFEDGLKNHVTIEGPIELSWIDTKISSENGSFIFSRVNQL
jgi:hypothetical protein